MPIRKAPPTVVETHTERRMGDDEGRVVNCIQSPNMSRRQSKFLCRHQIGNFEEGTPNLVETPVEGRRGAGGVRAANCIQSPKISRWPSQM